MNKTAVSLTVAGLAAVLVAVVLTNMALGTWRPDHADERGVGGWDVTPTASGVQAEQNQRVSIPQDARDELMARAREEGEPVSMTAATRFDHDLDSRTTDVRAVDLGEHDQGDDARRAKYARAAAAMHQQAVRRLQTGEVSPLSPRYAAVAKQLARQAQERQRVQKGKQQRRRSASRDDGLQKTSIPTIVVTTEPSGGPRIA